MKDSQSRPLPRPGTGVGVESGGGAGECDGGGVEGVVRVGEPECVARLAELHRRAAQVALEALDRDRIGIGQGAQDAAAAERLCEA